MSGRCAIVLGSEGHQRNVEGRAELTEIIGSCQRQRWRGAARFVQPSGSRVRRKEGNQRG
jgi:hypothetical protein